jgi:hypothetical protein
MSFINSTSLRSRPSMSFPDSSDWSEDSSEESVKRDKVPKLPRGRSYQIILSRENPRRFPPATTRRNDNSNRYVKGLAP